MLKFGYPMARNPSQLSEVTKEDEIVQSLDLSLYPKIELPRFVKVKQHFDRQKLDDIPGEIQKNMAPYLENLSGKRIAVGVGSRGIHNIDLITKCVVDQLKQAVRTRLLSRPWGVMAERRRRDKPKSWRLMAFPRRPWAWRSMRRWMWNRLARLSRDLRSMSPKARWKPTASLSFRELKHIRRSVAKSRAGFAKCLSSGLENKRAPILYTVRDLGVLQS